MAISEKIELIGKGLYGDDIPDVLTLKSIPTASELEYVGGEDFIVTMLDKILPKAVEEQNINFRKLLEIDFQWVCRCLRILNYGPYYTTNAIFCSHCGQTSSGEYQVDLRTVPVKPFPDGFTNDITVSKEEFLDFDGDIKLKLPTIQDMINADKDKVFKNEDGQTNRDLARMCYMIKSIKGDVGLTPTDIKYKLQNTMSSADFRILKSVVTELTDYGLRAGGFTGCPKCHGGEAAYIALIDDRFFRPTLGNLRAWKADRKATK